MHALGRSRRLTRLVAAWLLAWFALMQATALLRPPAALIQPPLAVHAQAGAGHHAHGAPDCDEAQSAPAHPSGQAGHTGANHLIQCPGCLFSTAPPPQHPLLSAANPPAVAAPAPVPAAAPRGFLLAQPPARGPPRFS